MPPGDGESQAATNPSHRALLALATKLGALRHMRTRPAGAGRYENFVDMRIRQGDRIEPVRPKLPITKPVGLALGRLFAPPFNEIGEAFRKNLRPRFQEKGADPALNAGVERFSADPEGVARLAYDADLSGLIVLPTPTMHALHDPTDSYGVGAVYAATVAAAGRSHLLIQVATEEDQHSKLQDAGYPTALLALDHWISTGNAPDPTAFPASCQPLTDLPGQYRFVTDTEHYRPRQQPLVHLAQMARHADRRQKIVNRRPCVEQKGDNQTAPRAVGQGCATVLDQADRRTKRCDTAGTGYVESDTPSPDSAEP